MLQGKSSICFIWYSEWKESKDKQEKKFEGTKYHIMLILMYFYSLIKHVRFNFKVMLRMKLLWTWKNSNPSYKENIGTLYLLYGFDNQTLYDYINSNFSREKIKEHKIATYFEYKESSNIFKVKEMYKNKFKELIVSKLGRESTIKFIVKF